MKRSAWLVLSWSVLALVLGSGAQAAEVAVRHDAAHRTITVTAKFATPRVTRDATGALAVSMPGLLSTVEAGKPQVPLSTVKVALPRGMRLASTRSAEVAGARLAGQVRLNHSMLPYSWRELDHSGLTAEAAPRVPARYPAQRVQSSVQVLHHTPIAVVNVYPVIAEGASCDVASEVSVTLAYEPDPAARGERGLTSYEAAAVRAFVDDPELVPAATAEPGYDYLILSSKDLIAFAGPNGFADFAQNLTARGLKSKIVDVADVAASTAGRDLQDKIRNFIRAEYQAHAIRYVLLAADGDRSGAGSVIPVRRMYASVNSYDGSWHTITNEIPADLYYSCLDGDFDGNGNGEWGEPTDGANGGDVDLLAEVVVGRMPMKTAAELSHFVAKTVAFASTARPKNALLMGEELFAEMNLYGDDYMNQLVGACADHGYQTNGFGSDWKIAHLYDKEASWNGSSALTKISSGGFSMVHHLGHSNTEYNMRMYSSKIKKFTNADPFFYYTQGCFPGDFTEDDCFIELLVRAEKGAVAAVANTCYGLGPEDPQPNTTVTPGASQMLHRRFVDASLNAGCESLGRANQASKEAFIGLASAPEMRWVFWDAHYFGDPSLKPPR